MLCGAHNIAKQLHDELFWKTEVTIKKKNYDNLELLVEKIMVTTRLLPINEKSHS